VEKSRNPYSWTTSTPKHAVLRRALMARVLDHLWHNEGTILLGARGMGKSVFLAQLVKEVASHRNIEVISFAGPPDDKTMKGAVGAVAAALAAAVERRLGDAAGERRERYERLGVRLRKLGRRAALADVLRAYFGALSEDVERVVLIFDEVEQYADPPSFGRSFFNGLEAIRKVSEERLAFVVAGGLRLLTLDTELGSMFFTRMKSEIVEPLEYADLAGMARAFEERGIPLRPEVLEGLLTASGGNALLVTYGLMYLWDRASPEERDVVEIFSDFEASTSRRIYRSIKDAVAGSGVAGIPLQVLEALDRNHGHVSEEEIARICAGVGDLAVPLEKDDILDLLRASGLVRIVGAGAGRIEAHPIPSIISFRLLAEVTARDTLQAQLAADLVEVLSHIHAMAPAFRRPSGADGAQLVPEGTFVACLCMGLDPRGWRVEVGSMSGAGFTDIRARHARFGEEKAIVEVKIWPRNDYKDIHDQVVSYATGGVAALATVMIAETKNPTWQEEYAQACLVGKVDSHAWHPLSLPLHGYFEARTGPHVVHHFLLQLPVRR